jgi:hypothetical protein
MRKAHNIKFENAERRGHLENLGVEDRVIFKYMLIN